MKLSCPDCPGEAAHSSVRNLLDHLLGEHGYVEAEARVIARVEIRRWLRSAR